MTTKTKLIYKAAEDLNKKLRSQYNLITGVGHDKEKLIVYSKKKIPDYITIPSVHGGFQVITKKTGKEFL